MAIDEVMEKKLRKIEVGKVWEKLPVAADFPQIVETSLEFCRLSIITKDFRFLNAALKLNDFLDGQRFSGIQLDEAKATAEEALRLVRKDCGVSV